MSSFTRQRRQRRIRQMQWLAAGALATVVFLPRMDFTETLQSFRLPLVSTVNAAEAVATNP